MDGIIFLLIRSVLYCSYKGLTPENSDTNITPYKQFYIVLIKD